MSSFAGAFVAEAVGGGILGTILGGAAGGALTGGVISGITGGSIGQGIIGGALGGALAGGISSAFGGGAAGTGGLSLAETTDGTFLMDAGGNVAATYDPGTGQFFNTATSQPMGELTSLNNGGYALLDGSGNATAMFDANGALTTGNAGGSSVSSDVAKKFGLSGAQSLGSAGANLIGAGLQSQAAIKSANTQAQAAATAGQQQLAMYDKQVALQAPWLTAGGQALGQLTQGVQPGGQFNKPYTLADFQSGPQSGLYDFAKGQALSAMNNQAAAGGQVQSTGAQIGAGQLAGNLANQFYNTGFNQNQVETGRTLNSLQSLAGQGQTATNQIGSATGALGNNLANLTIQQGNVNAAGQVGSANAYGNALSSIGNTFTTPGAMQTLANLFGP